MTVISSAADPTPEISHEVTVTHSPPNAQNAQDTDSDSESDSGECSEHPSTFSEAENQHGDNVSDPPQSFPKENLSRRTMSGLPQSQTPVASESVEIPPTEPAEAVPIIALELPSTFDLEGTGFVALCNLFPHATLDRAILYGENLNFHFTIPDTLTIMSLLGHFVVLERNPIQLGIICHVDFQDPEEESVAITINDVFFKAKPVTLP